MQGSLRSDTQGTSLVSDVYGVSPRFPQPAARVSPRVLGRGRCDPIVAHNTREFIQGSESILVKLYIVRTLQMNRLANHALLVGSVGSFPPWRWMRTWDISQEANYYAPKSWLTGQLLSPQSNNTCMQYSGNRSKNLPLPQKSQVRFRRKVTAKAVNIIGSWRLCDVLQSHWETNLKSIYVRRSAQAKTHEARLSKYKTSLVWQIQNITWSFSSDMTILWQ